MTHLFLAIPNYCGSTLVHNLLSTCPDVVMLIDPYTPQENGSNTWRKDFVEGSCVAREGYRNLHGPHSIEANMEHVYAKPSNYKWSLIKKIWDANWKKNNPTATIRLQKTPTDIFRIKSMLPYFPNTKWVVSIRNPYAYVESIMRKAPFAMEPVRQLDQICHHVLRTMELQLENIELLKDDAYVMTYEDFCARPEHHREQLGNWLAGLEQIDFTKELNVKGTHTTNVIEDDTEQRIQNMIDVVPNIIDMINEYFIPKRNLLDAWGYSLR